MRNSYRKLSFCTLIAVLALVLASSASAQLPNLGSNCAAGATVGPIDIAGSDSSAGQINTGFNGIDTSACGGNNTGGDGVICFTPQNSCTLLLECTGGPVSRQAKVGTGSCGDLSTCTTDLDTDVSIAVNAGQEYCLYCEHAGGGLLGYTITETGDCGLLPVELEAFSISSTDVEEEASDESESK